MTAAELINSLSVEALLELRSKTSDAKAIAAIDTALGAEDDD